MQKHFGNEKVESLTAEMFENESEKLNHVEKLTVTLSNHE